MASWKHFRLAGLLVTAVSALVIGEAQASRTVPSNIVMEKADPVLAPFGYVLMCRNHPSVCESSALPATIEGTADQMALLTAVNSEVNDTIFGMAKTDLAWEPFAMAGDCNDYAAGKRRRLAAAGIPSGAMFFAVARTQKGDTHNVLVVRTARGDLVLDNLRKEIKPWLQVGYSWLMRQSDENPRLWHRVVARRMQPPMPEQLLLAEQTQTLFPRSLVE